MTDVYKLLTNEYVKSIVLTYVTNSRKYKKDLARKYILEFFEIREEESLVKNDFYLNEFLNNIRWYISESYLKDIKTLNGKINIKVFWEELKPHFWFGIFQNITHWFPNGYLENLDFRFLQTNNKIECCLVYRVYRLAISHEYIKSNLFGKQTRINIYNQSLIAKPFTTIEELYNTFIKLYKDSPDNYAIKNGFLVLSSSKDSSKESI